MGGKGSGRRPRKRQTLPISLVVPDCPEWLNDRGKVEWARLANILDRVPDLIAEPDWDAVALLAAAWAEYHEADEVVQREGILAESQNGIPFQHPAVGVRNKAHERIVKLQHAIGATPQSRRLLNGATPSKAEPENPLTKYLRTRITAG